MIGRLVAGARAVPTSARFRRAPASWRRPVRCRRRSADAIRQEDRRSRGPFNRDSGTLRGNRTIWGGRASIRTALYRAALVATRHNPIIAALYRRLLAAGRPKKLALTASDAELDTAVMDVCQKMKADHDKSRVAFYYLLAEKFGKLAAFH